MLAYDPYANNTTYGPITGLHVLTLVEITQDTTSAGVPCYRLRWENVDGNWVFDTIPCPPKGTFPGRLFALASALSLRDNFNKGIFTPTVRMKLIADCIIKDDLNGIPRSSIIKYLPLGQAIAQPKTINMPDVLVCAGTDNANDPF